jgi:hypothetical protein
MCDGARAAAATERGGAAGPDFRCLEMLLLPLDYHDFAVRFFLFVFIN